MMRLRLTKDGADPTGKNLLRGRFNIVRDDTVRAAHAKERTAEAYRLGGNDIFNA